MDREKRRQPRITIDNLKITGKIIFANTVEIIDISTGGISFTSDRRMNLGSEYTLKIDENNKSLAVKGTVVWSTLHGNRKTESGDFVPLYAVGMEFTEIASEKISELVKFIEAHRQEETPLVKAHDLSGMRFNMRFHVNIDGRTTLDCPASYSVKEISMAGMLIESKTPLDIEKRLPMEFLLPENSQISFLGRVASCIPQLEWEPGYAIGIEFINMPKEHSQKLQKFISSLNQLFSGD